MEGYKLKVGLFIGRFQPFHLGHQEAIHLALKKVDILHVIIGSSNKSHNQKNPFTYSERWRMINLALINARIPSEKIFITPIPDLNNHKKWKEHIDFFVQDYDIVFTNDSETKNVFEKEGVKVSKIPFKNRKVLAGTQIRKRMASKKDWNNLVPNVVYEYINEINGQERMTVKSHKT